MRATLLVLLVATVAVASVPGPISYQGRLTDASGQPANGTFQLVFTIYADQGGTTSLWTETHPAVDVSDGLFSVLLGSKDDIGPSVFDGSARWLKVSVNGTASGELLPLVSTPYAHRSRAADTASYALAAAGGGAGGWVDDGSVVRLGTASDKIGIGTTAPEDRVHIENSAQYGSAFLRIETSHATDWGETGLRIETPQNRWHLRMDDESNNNLPDGALGLRTQSTGDEVMTFTKDGKVGVNYTTPEYALDVHSAGVAIRGYTTGGPAVAGVYGRATADAYGVMGTSTDGRGVYGASTNGFGGYFVGPKNYLSGLVGIGTESPTHTLTVNGSLGIQQSETTKYHFDYYNGGLNFVQTGVADYRLFLQDGGKVGIGTSSPQQKLHVAGNLKVNDTITAGAIFSSSIVDEPGLITAAQTSGVVGTSYDSLFSGLIEVPGPGHICIMATTAAYVNHTSSGSDQLWYGVNTSRTSLPDERMNYLSYGSNVGAGRYTTPVACQTLFTVGSAGTHRFYFVAKVSDADNWTVYNGRMILMYFPTLYAAKGEVVMSDASDESIALPTTDLTTPAVETSEPTEAADLRAELAALRSRLEALEDQLAGREP